MMEPQGSYQTVSWASELALHWGDSDGFEDSFAWLGPDPFLHTIFWVPLVILIGGVLKAGEVTWVISTIQLVNHRA